jgi:MFS-type transporter involved in bile tolerance (Atg22 family)
VLITLVGTAGVFLLNGLSFIILIVALAAMRIPPLAHTGPPQSILRSIGDGFAYLRGHETLRTLMILALAPMLFGMPYISLLPVFADDVLGIGNEGYGLLLSCTGVGALIGALTVASMGEYRRRGQLLLIIMIWYGVMLILFSRSTVPVLSYVLLFGVGAGQTGYLAFNMTLLQTHASDEMRGRVISFFYLNRGLVPLGTVAAGFAAQVFGVQPTVTAMGAMVVGLGLMTWWRAPRVREVE